MFEYNSRTIYFTNPGHIKAFQFYELKEAFLITFSEEFLETHIHQNIFNEFPFLLSETVPPQQPSEKEFQEIETLYQQTFLEYNSNSTYKNKIISNLLMVLLLKIKDSFWQNYTPIEEGNNQSNIVKTFKQNIELQYRDRVKQKDTQILQPQDYAKLQNLNASYFSQVIKSKTGKSPSQWINEKTISMAKSLLKNSSLSIKEITNAIGFAETAHFINFFKKQTGISPTVYRRDSKN